MGFLAWGLQVRTSFAVALCMCLRAALRCMGRAARRARQPRSVSVARMRCQQPSIQTVMIMVPAFMGMIITILQFRVRLELNVIVALFHECLCKSSGTPAQSNDIKRQGRRIEEWQMEEERQMNDFPLLQ
uniref:Uncharacterized protein n=1 Tax=Lotharella oceanica TaxID=641309 RepID=A0A7S2X772_9EUKA